LANGNDAFALFLQRTPEEHMAAAPAGWPPGHDPALYRAVPATQAPDTEAAVAASTRLGQALAAKGVTL
jgi:hypothetical protein